jgi:hypothetical protein
MSCRPCPGTDPLRVGGQRSVTVARPRVAPALGRTACQELSQSQPGSRSGRRPSHGDGGRPRGAQPNASKNLSASQAEPGPREELSLSSMVHAESAVARSCGQRRQERTQDVGCNRRWLDLQLPDLRRERQAVGVQISRPAAASPPDSWPQGGGSPRTGLTPKRVGSPSPPRGNDRHSRRPCHLPAIGSGDDRYIAVSHGLFWRAVPLGTRF